MGNASAAVTSNLVEGTDPKCRIRRITTSDARRSGAEESPKCDQDIAHASVSPHRLVIVNTVGGRPGAAPLSAQRTDRADCVLLVVRGDLDLPTEGQLFAAAWAVLRERVGRPVVLDLSSVGFIGSIGFSELLMICHEAASCDQEVRMVAGGNRRLRHLFRLLGPLRIYDSVDAACPVRAAAPRSLTTAQPEEPPSDTDPLGA